MIQRGIESFFSISSGKTDSSESMNSQLRLVLCSAHFKELCFEVDILSSTNRSRSFKTSRRRTLKPEAVPTIFQHVPQPKASIQRKHSSKRTVKSECEAVSKQ